MAPTEQSPEMLEGIIEGIFPRHDPSPLPLFVGQFEAGVGDEERVTDVEFAGIAKSLSVGKAPGPDIVQSLALKVAVAEAPEMFNGYHPHRLGATKEMARGLGEWLVQMRCKRWSKGSQYTLLLSLLCLLAS